MGVTGRRAATAARCASGARRDESFTWRGHTDYVQSIAWSPDGRWLASSSTDETIRIWNAKDGTCQRRLEDEIGAIFHVSWSGDGRWLASGGISEVIHIW